MKGITTILAFVLLFCASVMLPLPETGKTGPPSKQVTIEKAVIEQAIVADLSIAAIYDTGPGSHESVNFTDQAILPVKQDKVILIHPRRQVIDHRSRDVNSYQHALYIEYDTGPAGINRWGQLALRC